MRRTPLLGTAVVLCLALPAVRVAAQVNAFPTISARQYTSGTATVIVTGTTKMSQDITLNTIASISDGESTWLQYGASGSAEGDVLVTFGQTKEIGITVGKGKFLATGGITPGEKSQCTGSTKVTPTSVSGEYACTGLTSKEGSGMGKVDLKVVFDAKS